MKIYKNIYKYLEMIVFPKNQTLMYRAEERLEEITSWINSQNRTNRCQFELLSMCSTFSHNICSKVSQQWTAKQKVFWVLIFATFAVGVVSAVESEQIRTKLAVSWQKLCQDKVKLKSSGLPSMFDAGKYLSRPTPILAGPPVSVPFCTLGHPEMSLCEG